MAEVKRKTRARGKAEKGSSSPVVASAEGGINQPGEAVACVLERIEDTVSSVRRVDGRNGGTLTPWPPGRSGNLSGRPKNATVGGALRTLVAEPRKALEVADSDEANAMGLARELVKRGLAGDVRALEVIYERLEGKAVQPIVTADASKGYSTHADPSLLGG